MIQLDFQGVFHFDEIKQDGTISRDEKSYNLKKAGIYIWGFMYEYDRDTQTARMPLDRETDFNKIQDYNEINNRNIQFIPYYVGEADKLTIFDRIISHHKITKGNARMYKRLTGEYMKSFFRDQKSFPFHIRYKPKANDLLVTNMIQDDPWKLQYVNNGVHLNLIYQNINIQSKGKYSFPITLQKIAGNALPDTLTDLIITKNNFWFCYAVLPDPILNDPIIKIEDIETYTFWSLNGCTTSMTRDCPVINPNIIINDNTNTSIFQKGVIAPSNIFDGY